MSRLDSFFKLMAEQKASDLHLSTSNPPMLRINGDLVRVDFPPLQSDELKTMVYEIAPEGKIKIFEETSDVDFGYEVPGVARYRANFFQQKYGISAVFRLIPPNVMTLDELGLPPVLKRFAMLKKGLILVTGPTGSGKNTTLAAMVDYANLQRRDHIIDVFPTHQQNQIRTTLAESLKGVIAQNLFKRIDKPGRIAALEILVVDMAIANLVREAKTHQIPGMIQVGKKKGNQPLDDAILDHLRNARISPEEAYDKAIDKKKFRQFLKNPPEDWTEE